MECFVRSTLSFHQNSVKMQKKTKNNLNIGLFSLVKNASAVLARVKKYNPLSFMGFFLIANIVNFTTYTYSSKFFKYSMD